MPRKKRSEEQIVYGLRQVEEGAKIGDVCHQLGVTDQTYFRWKKQYAGLGMPEIGRLKQLEEENSTLKRLVADLSLDRHMLQEVSAKNSEGGTQAADRSLDGRDFCCQRPTGVPSAEVLPRKLLVQASDPR
jgi:putative transposase